MKLSIIKNSIFLYFVLGTSLSYSFDSINIRTVANLAATKIVSLCDSSKKCASISPESIRRLPVTFSIPFISIKHHLKEFVRDIPFVPTEALKLSIASRSFYIWQNESGIVCAPDPSRPENRAGWKIKILVDGQSSSQVNMAHLMLEIDERGNVEIKQETAEHKGHECASAIKPG